MCDIVDQRVEEFEEMKALSGDVVFAPVQVVEKEVSKPPKDCGRNRERVSQGENWQGNGKWHNGRQGSRGRSSSRTPSDSSSSHYRGCGVCRSLGRDSEHDYWQCKIAQAKRNGPFCGFCGSRGWECTHAFADCKKRLEPCT